MTDYRPRGDRRNMPHPPPNTSEAWDGVRETVDQFHPVPPSYYTESVILTEPERFR